MAAISITLRHLRNHLLFTGLLVCAYILRVIYPDLYMTGSDLPGHILASMRLHQTSLFNFQPLRDNFLAQTFQFTHGYTTLTLPWLMYELVFNLLGVTITERVLVFIHSLIGIASLLGVYAFLNVSFNRRVALTVLLFLAVTPVHIGLSRAFAGPLLFYLTFFYLSLACLHCYLHTRRLMWKGLYYLATFFYIGCDNAFMIGLSFHIIYLLISQEQLTWNETKIRVRNLYINPAALVFITLPVLAYLLVTAYSWQAGVTHGYLLRLFSKASLFSLSFDPFKVLGWILILIGPIGLVFYLAFLFRSTIDQIKSSRSLQFLLGISFAYSLLFAVSSQVERNYGLFLTVPVAVLTALFIGQRKVLVGLLTCLTLVYSLSVVYNLKIGFPTIQNYGSINHQVKNNDYGIKTLGYLVRSGEIFVSHGESETSPIGLFLAFEGGQYYLGENYNDWVERDIQNNIPAKYPVYVFAYLIEDQDFANQFLMQAAQARQLHRLGKIMDGDRELVSLFSNYPVGRERIFQVSEYNPKFDRVYGNLDELPRTWLGIF